MELLGYFFSCLLTEIDFNQNIFWEECDLISWQMCSDNKLLLIMNTELVQL